MTDNGYNYLSIYTKTPCPGITIPVGVILMDSSSPNIDEHEVLIRTIDLLSMDILRLKSENETLKMTLQTLEKNGIKRGVVSNMNRPANVWSKAINYYRREGLRNTIKKVFNKLSGR